MPMWEHYNVQVTVSWEIKAGGNLIAAGMAPGDGRGHSNRNVTNSPSMTDAAKSAFEQAVSRAVASVEASEVVRQKELSRGE